MLEEEMMKDKDLNPSLNLEEREVWNEKMSELKDYKKRLLDHLEAVHGNAYSFYMHDLGLEVWDRLRDTGLSHSEIINFAAIHPIIGSTASYERSPRFDLPDALIMKTFLEIYEREMQSSNN